MSKKTNSSQEQLGKGSMKKLSDLEEFILQDETAVFSMTESTPTDDAVQPQPLAELASLEGDLLQDSSEELAKQQPTEVDADALWDSIAELEEDFLFYGDEPADNVAVVDDVAASEASMPIDDVVPILAEDETAVIEPPQPEQPLGAPVATAEPVTDETAVVADMPEVSLDSVQAFEEEILSTQAAEAEIFSALESIEPVQPIAEEPSLVDALSDEEPLLEIGESIELAFAIEEAEATNETAVDEPASPEPDVADEWDALADVEADLLTEPEMAPESELAELSALESDLLQAEETVAEVEEAVEPETAVVTDEPEPANTDIFEAFFAEADAAELEAAAADLADVEADMVEEQEGETAVVEPAAVESAHSETVFASEEPADPDFLAELEAEEHHFLDDLIASIDSDLATARATETMFDLSTTSAVESETLVQHVIFTLGNIKCAVPALNIREVGEINYITPVPNVPDWLLGITSLRGDILSLVDLSGLLGLTSNEAIGLGISEVEIMVVQSQQDPLAAITTGLVVDEVDDIQDIPMEQVRMPTSNIDNQLGTFMQGVYEENGQMIVLLDLESLLMSPEMWQFEAI